jgi:acetyl esterase
VADARERAGGRRSARLGAAAQLRLLQLLARLPAAVQRRLSGGPPVVVDGQTLDAHLQLVLALRARRRAPGLVEPGPVAGRERFRREMIALAGPKTRVGGARDLELPGPAGPIASRHYAPESSAAEPLLVFLHGGGFVIGDLDTHDEPCRLLCRHARTHVLSVAYRLAPEHPFPAGLEDARAALRWAQANATALGADAAGVAIGGDSAGGNLALVAALLATRAGQPPVAQLAIYPPTGSSAPDGSRALFASGYFLDARDRAAFTRLYTGGAAALANDPRVSPLAAGDHSGLPPAFVVTAGFDILRDEGEAYAAALRRAGTPAEHRHEPALGHGFIQLTGINPASRRATITLAREWRRFLDAARA